jgi:peptidoglycan/xylan/chitin deacetylase (PgdA/CDA1 family)
MLRRLRRAALQVFKGTGIFHAVRESRWRRSRLLILCYHGISLEDEHQWRPALYMEPAVLEQRLELLRTGGYNVLLLGEALQRLRTGDLPPKSVAITFDDGNYDFYRQAHPRLKSYGFPVTVYQTTYYSDYPRPIFNVMCSYLLWKRRGEVLDHGKPIGIDEPLDLRTEAGRHKIVRALIDLSDRENLTGRQKDGLAGGLAKLLGVDYEELVAKRVLQLMNPKEIAQVASEGVDIQLHTHRHRTPSDQALFQKEVRDNRERIREITGSTAVHFCYPSGVYSPQFLPWLAEDGVVSATTCDAGLASSRSHAFLLPRFVDTRSRTPLEFESWLAGVGALISVRRAATQRYEPAPD